MQREVNFRNGFLLMERTNGIVDLRPVLRAGWILGFFGVHACGLVEK